MNNNPFLVKATAIILSEIDSINVKQLSQRLSLHPSHVYRKVDAIASCSPSILIRDIRLSKSEELLKTTSMMVKDVGYSVGFSTPSYFIECFRRKYGITPGEFRNPSNI